MESDEKYTFIFSRGHHHKSLLTYYYYYYYGVSIQGSFDIPYHGLQRIINVYILFLSNETLGWECSQTAEQQMKPLNRAIPKSAHNCLVSITAIYISFHILTHIIKVLKYIIE